jgi:mannose-6-phosphate isomerase
MSKKIEPFHPRSLMRDWGAEIIVGETDTYLGKVLVMNPGTRGGLQYHVDKDETFFLYEGRALVRSDDGHGQLNVIMMLPGQAFHIPPGAVHQVEAIERCVFFESSTPHHNDRVRCEKQYGMPEGGGLPTTR